MRSLAALCVLIFTACPEAPLTDAGTGGGTANTGGGDASGGGSATGGGAATGGGSATGGGTTGGGATGGGTAGGGTTGGGTTGGGTTGGGSASGGGAATGGNTGRLITIGVGGDRRYSTTDGNLTIQGDVQDLAPSDADWADGHTDTMIRGHCYGNGRFLAVGGQSDGTFRSTTDGLTWTALTTLDGQGGRASADWLGGCAYGNGRFVAAGGNGSRCFSTDGLTWQCPAPYQSFHHRAVAFGGGRFVTVGNSYAMTPMHITSISTDGSMWTDIPALNNTSANLIIWVESHRAFYAVFGNTLGTLAAAGNTWTAVAGVDVSGVTGATVKDDTVYFIGTRPMAPYTRFLISSADGAMWNTQTPNLSAESIHWDQQGHFLGNRTRYPQPTIPVRLRSTDGVTWTEVQESMSLHGVRMFVTGTVP